ncbi:Cu(I)-responsive transcriptional regulator [Zoogloea sp. LCSB751]|uniref:Cu(I)-responsive transcriptional regulator n=1 Tax=Zoogloea sp. LCSB751 TaxID=1965277 RepID=UPI0009A53499|nr:Cu(I)-responsive transcriptional regulator [Zoogloea sp. LCSB751]
MNIGAVAAASGVSAKMIRHYEKIGLLGASARSTAGYRQYGERDVQTLHFVRHARDLGFPLEQIGQLLSLWQDTGRSSAEVKCLAEAHLQDLDARIHKLSAMRDTLATLARNCCGDERPDCPILDGLAASAQLDDGPKREPSR